MKNKLFIMLPFLLVGLVGCGNKGGGKKDTTTPIDFYNFHQLALQLDEKDNPNKYGSALGYAYDYNSEDARINFALEDKYEIDSAGNVQYVEGYVAYRDLNVYNIVNLKASMVEDDDMAVYYKHSNGGLGYYMIWADGIERYEFDQFGRLIHAVTEYDSPEAVDDRRVLLVPYMDADMDLTVTWSKTLSVSGDYHLGFDAQGGIFEDRKTAKILTFPKDTTETYFDVLKDLKPFYLGKEPGGWTERGSGYLDRFQPVSQDLAFDVTEYITNFMFGTAIFDETTTEITLEYTVDTGYQTCVQFQFGESFYQKSLYTGEGPHVERVTLQYGNYEEPRARRDDRTLHIYGKVYSVTFANADGIYNPKNAGLLSMYYEFSESWVAKVPSYSFKGCNNLRGIYLPDDESCLVYIADHAFASCGQNGWQLWITKNLAMDEDALNGCTATVVYSLSKIPNNTEDPGYEAWRTFPISDDGPWDTNYANGFEGHFTFEAYADFVYQIDGEGECTFAIYWEDNLASITVQSLDLYNNTDVIIYDEFFSEMETLDLNMDNSYTNTYAYQANEWIYITVIHDTEDTSTVRFSFNFEM